MHMVRYHGVRTRSYSAVDTGPGGILWLYIVAGIAGLLLAIYIGVRTFHVSCRLFMRNHFQK